MSTWTIYCYTHIENGKRYIGQTKRSVAARWKSHTFAARHGSQLPFHRAIAKYGADTFSREVLDVVDTLDAANEAEKLWISRFGCVVPAGYNLNDGGNARATHADTRAKMRAAAAKRTPEERSAHARKAGLGNTSEAQRARAEGKYAGLTPEQRSLASRGSTTPEQRSVAARSRQAAKTPAARRASAALATASMTHEQRSDRARAGWITRRIAASLESAR